MKTITEKARKEKAKEIIEFQIRCLKETFMGDYYKAKTEYYGSTYWIINTIYELEIIDYQEYRNYIVECERYISSLCPF